MNTFNLSTIFSLLSVLALGVVIAACDLGDGFLDEQPRGALAGDVVATEQGVETLLIGTYSALSPSDGGTASIAGGLDWMADPSLWVYGTVASDDAQKGSEPGDQQEINPIQENRFSTTNPYFNSMWSNRFEGIARANETLRTLEQVEDINETTRARIEGEARFLRAHFYFDLRKMFENVPWVDETMDDPNQPNDEDIWPRIEEDFEFAMENLPEQQSDLGRANSWAAASYLAKAFVYQEKWSEAQSMFNDIIPNGVTVAGEPYDLADRYSDNFSIAGQGADNPEIIFAVRMTGADGSGEIANSWSGHKLNYPFDSPFNCCGFYQPSHDLVNAFETNDEGLPLINEGFTAETYEHDQGLDSDELFDFSTDISFDPRLDWTVGRRGVAFHDHGPHPGADYIRDTHSYAGPFSSKKHVYRRADGDDGANLTSWAPGTGVDYPVIRFADVLLMAAEAELEVGSTEQARQYVNRVRERAANEDDFVSTSLNEAYAAETITDESELDDLDVSTGDWVVDTENDVTYVLIDSDTWQEYPNPADTYEISEIPAGEFESNPTEYVRFERRVELGMEGHRFFDLVRWGEAADRMDTYYDFQGAITRDVEGASFQNEIYPIPQRQIDLSEVDGEPLLEQNPGF